LQGIPIQKPTFRQNQLRQNAVSGFQINSLGFLHGRRDSVRLPGFWRFDAGLFAKIDETWSAQLNVDNIFNKSYWATADGNNNISPGQGRTVRVSARARS
jgi:outer membrane receptor protein involved in Fe transport